MKKALVVLVSTIMLGMSACVVAEPSNRVKIDNKGRYDQRYDHRQDHRKPPHWSNANKGHHSGQRITFKRGERLPSQFRSSRYVVSNYRQHRLYQPPRGYQWMQVQGRYVLVDSQYRVYRVA
ncbi:RcnB family protein [Acinetobacter sp. NIPH 2699]|uniref:RcnB family protein n=1 Tax=Acinetobacter sp. NIPH 2699 TaxID=2923433 RepID=UPI001F4A1881|nr:RcnB family protein [Acinetobacter sp. NIPH 2699]MCH7336505.1 RcnB family protein [Acinetobacter sp. NIPH 2699]